MSKKNKKYQKQRKKNFPWLFVALGGILLAAAAFFFANQGGGNGGGTPSIAVDQQLIDYGDVKFNVEKTFAISREVGESIARMNERQLLRVRRKFGMVFQGAAGLGRLDAAGAALEELHAEAAFQVRKPLARRGQGQVFLGGTAGDRARLLDGQHEIEGGEIVAHDRLSPA